MPPTLNWQGAEELVAHHLAHQGWLVLARNFRCRGSELDIVAQKQSTLIAVEVKLRQPRYDLSWEDLLPPKKRQSLITGLNTYMSRYEPNANFWRVDLAIVCRKDGAVVDYFPDVCSIEDRL
jgi:putative endonuclease